MRPLLILALLPAFLGAAPAFQIVRPVLSQMDGGAPDPPGFEHTPGEVVFFSCRIAGYSKSPEEKVQLRFSVQAFDPQGVPLDEIYKNEMDVEVGPQDKEWEPKISTSLALPPLAPPPDEPPPDAGGVIPCCIFWRSWWEAGRGGAGGENPVIVVTVPGVRVTILPGMVGLKL